MLDGLLDGQMPGRYNSFKSSFQKVVTCAPCFKNVARFPMRICPYSDSTLVL